MAEIENTDSQVTNDIDAAAKASVELLKVQVKNVLKPQPGPQTVFLSTSADIAIYGGGAGSGKTHAILLEAVRHIKLGKKKFKAIIFRRTTAQVRQGGGIWDDTASIYPLLQELEPEPVESRVTWKFKNKCVVKFAHLQHEKTKYNYQGAQIPLIIFDELTHFTKGQFFYMLSRNRAGNSEGVRPYIRATCNPDPDSWVKDFISWWLDEDGFPIPERSGKLRWMIKEGNKIIWADSKEELLEKYPKCNPLSVTFIPALIKDNPALLEKDPGYMARLENLDYVERMQLLYGNWKVRAAAGNVFKKAWFKILKTIPDDIVKVVRFWDKAGTEEKKNEKNPEPDSTSGTLMGITKRKNYIILHNLTFQGGSGTVETTIKRTAKQDYQEWGSKYFIGLHQDPGSAGVFEKDYYVKILAGFIIKIFKPTKNKVTMAGPLAAQAEHGNIYVLEGEWNNEFLEELEAFPDALHDDRVDATSWAFSAIALNSVETAKEAKAVGKVEYNPDDF